MSTEYEVTIIIVNYNTGALLTTCLASLFSDQGKKPEVIVVDNASSDNSLAELTLRYPQVRLIRNRTNRGFAAANNQAVPLARGDLLFFLNPDTELRPQCLSILLHFMAEHPDIGLAGPAIYEKDGSVHPSTETSYPGQRYAGEEFGHLPGRIAWILGAAMMARRDAVFQVEGFDERFFLYAEDIDICLELRKKGWALGYVPEAGVMHLEGQSERHAPAREVMERKVRAELLFCVKHYSEPVFRRIRRARLVQARWRLLTLRLEKLLFGAGEEWRWKLMKYRVIADLYGRSADGESV